jgi:minichromosome maintenance protein 10
MSSSRTTGMSTSSAPKRQPAYDPVKQWGLKPADGDSGGGGGSTYVVSGHIVNGSGADSRSLYTTENIGREGQAKAKRKLLGKDADRALKGLLERDKEGMRAVMKAREVGKANQDEGSGKKDKKRKGVEKTNDSEGKSKKSKLKTTEDSDDDCPARETNFGKNAYSAEVIKQLGFDPIAKAGQRRGGDSDMQKKVRRH